MKKNHLLAPYTSYGIGGTAREVYFPETADELSNVLGRLHGDGTDYFLLGGGTNVLVGDGYWDGAVVVTTGLDRIECGESTVCCGAGCASSAVAETARERGKTGVEFLYKLPGTIGGAFAGNARFDNTSVSDVLHAVTAVHPEQGKRRFAAEEIEFAYKYVNIVADGWIAAGIELEWSDGDRREIRERMDRIEAFRHEHHHYDYPSSGCMFKNDHVANIQCGRLIDSLGLKGLREGGAMVAGFHANFIINTGGATARDVLTLLERIEREVKAKTGITLEREVRVLGTFGD